MYKEISLLENCRTGDVIAEDVENDRGLTLVAKNTVFNPYIKLKLEQWRISTVSLYIPEHVIKERKALETVKKGYYIHVTEVKQFLYDLATTGSIQYSKIQDLSDSVLKNNNCDNYLIIKCLSDIKSADEYTYTHSVNVAMYSMLIGKWMNMTSASIKELVEAALLHDIGKIKIPLEILNKNGKLTEEEYEIIKEHPHLGKKLLLKNNEVPEKVLNAVLMHHERIDGSGYPNKLTMDNIDLYARIIAIADVFDAMTQNRVYKKKVSPFDAFQMFTTIGFKSFDPGILMLFLKHISVLYMGFKVLLSTGDVGEIAFIPPQDVTSPVIYVNNQYIDIAKENHIKILEIL